MDCGARLVLGLLMGRSRAFVALGKLHLNTTLTAFATVADVTQPTGRSRPSCLPTNVLPRS